MKGVINMSVKKGGLGKGLSALIKDKEKVDLLINDIKLLPDRKSVV